MLWNTYQDLHHVWQTWVNPWHLLSCMEWRLLYRECGCTRLNSPESVGQPRRLLHHLDHETRPVLWTNTTRHTQTQTSLITHHLTQLVSTYRISIVTTSWRQIWADLHPQTWPGAQIWLWKKYDGYRKHFLLIHNGLYDAATIYTDIATAISISQIKILFKKSFVLMDNSADFRRPLLIPTAMFKPMR